MMTTTMTRYRRRPTETTAVQLRWTTWNEVGELLGPSLKRHNPNGARETSDPQDIADTCGEPGPTYLTLNVLTVNGILVPVRHGDWIIPDSAPGTFYPCAPDTFAKTYEAAADEAPATHPARALASVLLDLDRCEHGRHAADPCHSCPGGQSAGNQLLPPGRVIGHNVYADPIWVPAPDDRHEATAWRTPPADPAAADDPAVNAVYRERNRLVASLTTRWPSVITEATDFDGWWIVYMNTPAGQLSWHFPPGDLDLFDGVRRVDSWEWDGHNTEQKYTRLAQASGTEFAVLEGVPQ